VSRGTRVSGSSVVVAGMMYTGVYEVDRVILRDMWPHASEAVIRAAWEVAVNQEGVRTESESRQAPGSTTDSDRFCSVADQSFALA
jgi:hypothetical protein